MDRPLTIDEMIHEMMAGHPLVPFGKDDERRCFYDPKHAHGPFVFRFPNGLTDRMNSWYREWTTAPAPTKMTRDQLLRFVTSEHAVVKNEDWESDNWHPAAFFAMDVYHSGECWHYGHITEDGIDDHGPLEVEDE